MRERIAGLMIFLICVGTSGSGISAPRDRLPAPELELRIRPLQHGRGVPQAFTFELISLGAKDLRLPEPNLQCGADYTGSIWLHWKFVALHPGGQEMGTTCLSSRTDWPPIEERITPWRVLHAGGSVFVSAGRKALGYGEKPGTYEFWASYTPPEIAPADRETLQADHIEFPRVMVDSNHLKFTKRR